MDVAGSLRSVKERIGEAAARAGRPAGDIKLVAVTKGVEPARIVEAIKAGHLTFVFLQFNEQLQLWSGDR